MFHRFTNIEFMMHVCEDGTCDVLGEIILFDMEDSNDNSSIFMKIFAANIKALSGCSMILLRLFRLQVLRGSR